MSEQPHRGAYRPPFQGDYLEDTPLSEMSDFDLGRGIEDARWRVRFGELFGVLGLGAWRDRIRAIEAERAQRVSGGGA